MHGLQSHVRASNMRIRGSRTAPPVVRSVLHGHEDPSARKPDRPPSARPAPHRQAFGDDVAAGVGASVNRERLVTTVFGRRGGAPEPLPTAGRCRSEDVTRRPSAPKPPVRAAPKAANTVEKGPGS